MASFAIRSSCKKNFEMFLRARCLGHLLLARVCSPGALLCSVGFPVSKFPHVTAPTARSDLSTPAGPGLSHHGVPISRQSASRLHPRFLDVPLGVRAAVLDPGRTDAFEAMALRHRASRVAFDAQRRLGSYDHSAFGTYYLRPIRSLSYASWPRSPVDCLRPRQTRFRRDGLRRRRWDLHPGYVHEVSGATSFLFDQVSPGAL